MTTSADFLKKLATSSILGCRFFIWKQSLNDRANQSSTKLIFYTGRDEEGNHNQQQAERPPDREQVPNERSDQQPGKKEQQEIADQVGIRMSVFSLGLFPHRYVLLLEYNGNMMWKSAQDQVYHMCLLS